MAGMACRVLGWRPGDFWNSTPAEITAIFSTDDDPQAVPFSRVEFEKLMKRDGDG